MQTRLLASLLLLVLIAACKSADQKSCDTDSVGKNLRFRLVDKKGDDLLYPRPGRVPITGFHITQPCNSDSLVPLFTTYRIPGTEDSGITFNFGNLATPEYGMAGECMRFYLNWSGDIDTLDWHYKIEEQDGCMRQVIDYMSYNGTQAVRKYDNAYDYYPLVKNWQ